MIQLPGHQDRSPVHQRAVAAGLSVARTKSLDRDTTLVEYRGVQGCYLYFGPIAGAFRVNLAFDDVLKIWPDSELPLRMARAGVIVQDEFKVTHQ